MNKPKKRFALSPFFVFVFIVAVFLLAIIITVLIQKESTMPRTPSETTIISFVRIHENLLGKYEKMESMPDWAEGERKKVTTSLGSFLFYFKGGEIVTVDLYKSDGSRETIWRKE